MVNLYIRTRGLRIDYSYLLESPERSYSKDYKSDIEKPTCILERTKEKVYLFLSGIPSQRKDHQGTPIRYELVATDSEPWDDWHKNSDQEKYLKGLTGLISMWLKDVRTALQEIQEDGKSSELVRLPIAKNSDLGKLLDQTLPEEYIEELLQLSLDYNQSQDKKKNLDEKLEKLISQIPAPSDLQEAKCDESKWWGGINNENSCNEWIKLVEKLLQGENEAKGKALLLNIATLKSLDAYAKKDEELGVLLAKEWSQSPPEPIKYQDVQENNPIASSWNSVKESLEPLEPEIIKRLKKNGQELYNNFRHGSD